MSHLWRKSVLLVIKIASHFHISFTIIITLIITVLPVHHTQLGQVTWTITLNSFTNSADHSKLLAGKFLANHNSLARKSFVITISAVDSQIGFLSCFKFTIFFHKISTFIKILYLKYFNDHWFSVVIV